MAAWGSSNCLNHLTGKSKCAGVGAGTAPHVLCAFSLLTAWKVLVRGLSMRAAVIMEGYTAMHDSRKQARQSFFVEMVDLHFRDQFMRGA